MGSSISNGIGPVFRGQTMKVVRGSIEGPAFNTLNSSPVVLLPAIQQGVPVILSAVLFLNFSTRSTVTYYIGCYPYLFTFGGPASIVSFDTPNLSDPGIVQAGVNPLSRSLNLSPGANIVLYSENDDPIANFTQSFYELTYYEAFQF